MTHRSLPPLLAAALLAVHLVAPPAAAPAEKVTKRTWRDAEAALAAGRTAEAIELYRAILDATSLGDARRAEALWAMAVLHLSGAPDDRDPAAARAALSEALPTIPAEHRAAARALLGAVTDLEVERSAAQALGQQLTAERELCDRSRDALGRRLEEREREAEALRADTAAHDARLAALEADKAALAEDIARKEEALVRMDEALTEMDEALRHMVDVVRDKTEAIAAKDRALAQRDQALQKKAEALKKVTDTLLGSAEAVPAAAVAPAAASEPDGDAEPKKDGR